MEVKILYKLRCPGGITENNLSDYGTIQRILEKYRVPSKDVLEILTRLIDIDNLDTKFMDNLDDTAFNDNETHTVTLDQSCTIGHISSHYSIIFDHKAAVINPDNRIIRRLSFTVSSGIDDNDKYEIVFLEQEENDSFKNFGANYVISTSRIHSKVVFDKILQWLSDAIEIDISIDNM